MTNEKARREIDSLDYYLQNHTNDYSEESHMAMMMAINALEQQPCKDCISREQAVYVASGYCAPQNIADELRKLPSVTPKFTDEEIQKMQDLEQAQLDKAYELGKAESFEEWLSSFNTESATECFTAVQELKKRLEVNMKDIKRELSKEEYEKGKINPYYLISDDIKMGYGAYGAEVHEEDGKYYLTFSMGDSCD